MFVTDHAKRKLKIAVEGFTEAISFIFSKDCQLNAPVVIKSSVSFFLN